MNKILILDFGSQYTQLIARRIREAHVYSEIHPCTLPTEKIREFAPGGIVLSGGPASVMAPQAPQISKSVFEMKVPVLGICYGMQLMAHHLGGKVHQADRREYGRAQIRPDAKDPIFEGIPNPMTVWMSHGDRIETMPPQFYAIAQSDNSPVAAFVDPQRKLYGLQFHPEVTHTSQGFQLIQNFLFKVCGLKPTWDMASFAEEEVARIRSRVGKEQVVLGLSGGVDSSVAAVLIHRAIGDQLHCILVDNGLLRKNEAVQIEEVFAKHMGIPLMVVDARERFLKNLGGVTDPEAKRKIIGKEFVAVFEAEAKKIKGVTFLAQGTLYPDVIESVSFKGPSAVIKSHHNVGGLPEKMGLKLIEPLRELFKDEVRALGRELKISEAILGRQPFPGPGLGVRILGEVTSARLDLLREADAILMQEIKNAGWYHKMWQAFCVLLPVKTVGVMGDERTYENVIAIRAVESTDGMTADWVKLPHDLLGIVSNRIINEVRGINRVVYDISSKPPATIEWE